MPSVGPCKDAVGFDTSAKLCRASAKAAATMGFQFAIQYVSLGDPLASDVDAETIAVITGEIGAVWIIQRVRNPGWSPAKVIGQADGRAAAANALRAGYLAGATLWQDLEGIAAGTSPQAVIDYTCAWGDAVLAEGYLHGLYAGYAGILTPAQLYATLPTVRSYWVDYGVGRSVAVRGESLRQVCGSVMIPSLGVEVDIDICHADLLGGRPMWMQG
jgi:Domain of unknown function (DUF1906)